MNKCMRRFGRIASYRFRSRIFDVFRLAVPGWVPSAHAEPSGFSISRMRKLLPEFNISYAGPRKPSTAVWDTHSSPNTTSSAQSTAHSRLQGQWHIDLSLVSLFIPRYSIRQSTINLTRLVSYTPIQIICPTALRCRLFWYETHREFA